MSLYLIDNVRSAFVVILSYPSASIAGLDLSKNLIKSFLLSRPSISRSDETSTNSIVKLIARVIYMTIDEMYSYLFLI